MSEHHDAPLILSFDTSLSSCTVALSRGSELVAGRQLVDAPRHSRHLLALLHDCAAEAGLTPGEAELIAVTTGPGSFTGIRIGMATAQGLAVGQARRLLALSSLEALALSAQLQADDPSALSLAAIDARNRRAYLAVYDGSRPLFEAQLDDIAVLAAALDQCLNDDAVATPRRLLLAGDGAALIAQAPEYGSVFARHRLSPEWEEAPAAPLPAALALLAARAAAEPTEDGQPGLDPAAIRPLYLSASNAEKARGEALPEALVERIELDRFRRETEASRD